MGIFRYSLKFRPLIDKKNMGDVSPDRVTNLCRREDYASRMAAGRPLGRCWADLVSKKGRTKERYDDIPFKIISIFHFERIFVWDI